MRPSFCALTHGQAALLAGWALFAITFSLGAEDYGNLFLQHLLTVVGLGVIVWCNRRQRWSTTALLCLLAFLTLHTIGARWLYSYVPYDQWMQALWGQSLSELMHWRRNHYDRLVHFSYGLLLSYPLYERLRLHFAPRLSAWLSFELIASSSMFYELLEWLVALVLDPRHAEAYNGQQGDMFDPHKDMALAVSGALLTLSLLVLRQRALLRTDAR